MTFVSRLAASSVLSVLLLTVTIASAQVPSSLSSVPSGSTYTSAALEESGYAAQEQVLNDLGQLIDRFGLLIFIAVIVALIFTYIVFGSADGVLWLLVGVTLFYFVTKTTHRGNRIEWRYSSEVTSSDKSYRVSWLFDRANNFVSSITRELIKILTSDDSQKLMSNFMTRERILSELLTLQIDNGGFRSFATETLLQCSKEMDAARSVSLGERDLLFQRTNEYVDAKLAAERFRANAQQGGKYLGNHVSKDYVKTVLTRVASHPGSDTGPVVMRQCAGEARDFVARHGGLPSIDTAVNSPMSCHQLWCWMGLGIFSEVSEAEADIQQRYGLDTQTFNEIRNEIAVKLQTPELRLDPYGRRLGNRDPVQPDPSLIPVIIGGYLIREMMQDVNLHSPALAAIGEKTGIVTPAFNFSSTMNDNQVQAVGLLNSEHVLAVTKQFEILTLIHSLPYLQGLLLYFLSLSFPFFAVLLLIPGRAQAFLLWFGLWAWAKFWDVGWSIVMLLEQFLWSMLPHSGAYDPLHDPNHGPISVFDAAFRTDPSYHIATYYVIVAVLLGAVPLLTAQLLLGAKASMLTPMVQSLERFASGIGGGVNAWTKVEQVAPIDQMREAFVGRFVSDRSGDIMDSKNHSSVSPVIGQFLDQHIRPIEEKIAELQGMSGETVALSNVYMGLGASGAAADVRVGRQAAILALQRAANDGKANALRVNRDLLYYEAGQSEQYRMYDTIRGGISRRAHPWDKDDSPWGSIRDLDQNEAIRNALVGNIYNHLDAQLKTAIYK
jgi:hypothetical protein